MNNVSIVPMTILLIVLLFFSAFFSGSETALMAISRLRLSHLSRTKPRRARLVEQILQRPERLIGTILLGNNMVNVAMSAIATVVAISFWGEKGIVYVTVVLTLAILIFAEITPKVYAKYFNERVSLIAAPVLKVIMLVMKPVVIAVTFLANKLLLLAGIDVSKIKRPLMTESEIKTCIQMGSDDGAITTEERKMLSRIFTLNDKTVAEVMVPKEKMTTISIDASVSEVMKTIMDRGYSRLPVTTGKDMDIIGFIHAKDLLKLKDAKKKVPLKKIIRPPYFIPYNKHIDVQLRSFKTEKLHQAIVLGKEGEVVGLVTLEDILEELVGSIQDEYDHV